MTNGAATQFIYPGSGSPSSSSGSPMANTPESHHPVPSVIPQQYFTQFPQEAAFYHPYYISYSSSASVYTDYELQDQQTNDDRSSTVSSPHSEMSERSGERSPAVISRVTHRVHQSSVERSNSPRPNPSSTPSNDNQVPVVSWKSYSEEREIYIRDGRRAFHPAVPPPAPTPPTPPPHRVQMYYPQSHFPGNFSTPNTVHQQSKPTLDSRNQRQNSRGRPTRIVTSSNMPYIPKFPAYFNNNNPLVSNNNYHDKKPSDMSNRGNRQGNRNTTGGHSRGPSSRNSSPHNPKPSYSNPQMMPQVQPQHFDRPTYVMAANNSAPRWSNVPQNSMKRIATNKKQNGSNFNLGGNNTQRGGMKKMQGDVVEQDVGGGGDAQLAMNRNTSTPPGELNSKMQSLALETSS